VRRLHAEGHTLESIRLALLDVGVSVSISTVRREVVRRSNTREPAHVHSATFRRELGREDSRATSIPIALPTLSLHDVTSVQSHGPADDTPALRQLQPLHDHHRASLFSNVFGALRRALRFGGHP
jgi:hypothetical protein